jgi:threonyl-tRNA synthetase
MLAILAEHYQGKWPFWLSPRQVMIVPVHQGADLTSYATHIQSLFRNQLPWGDFCTLYPQASSHAPLIQELLNQAQWKVDLNLSHDTLNRKIRSAQQDKYNYVVVVGDQELSSGTVNLRSSWTPMELASGPGDRPLANRSNATVADLVSYFHQLGQPFIRSKLNTGVRTNTDR